MRTTDAPTDEWKQDDQATVKHYLETYGKARDFVEDTEIQLSVVADGKGQSSTAMFKEERNSEGEEMKGMSEKEMEKVRKAKIKEDELASKRVEEIAMLRKRLDESIVLVLPGDIVHMYRDNGKETSCFH